MSLVSFAPHKFFWCLGSSLTPFDCEHMSLVYQELVSKGTVKGRKPCEPSGIPRAQAPMPEGSVSTHFTCLAAGPCTSSTGPLYASVFISLWTALLTPRGVVVELTRAN